ncbi:acyl carrier protein [Tissierella carlieri]|jgi:acyl carrier protein|uniref:Acyl carrier protein n=1 Tax=Tissierella carlieri TaxID=689904 RepID=A0ABT1S5T0_9FIRM|nr:MULTISPECIES: acyl carrier protein [Tissierella]MBU5314198.1 acyl carrier protein [Tissierella carlieri]MCQ4921822.1 acyl carrier protein [Tissierella carlieri]MDU5079850.1 acyl carrier protein [Bacillota bacterium]OZV12875.1 acyl carrier protein [Tissierella sp. P1]
MIYKKIKTIIATQFNIDEDEITKDTSFKDTLNADSLDLVELIMALEDEFGLEVEDEEMENIKTVGDAVEYITNALEE